MTRRQLYRLVADVMPAAGGAQALLEKSAVAMRSGIVPTEIAGLRNVLKSDDALGQIYQAINAPALETAYRATSGGRKFAAREIPLVTQLFTPRWVVEFLLENSLGRMWLAMHPDSRLRRFWEWLVPMDCRPEPVKCAGEIRICDPACGTMNFGLVAVDMLRRIYREEISRRGRGGWPTPSCGDANEIDASIICNNLFGFDIDPVAIRLARTSLEIKTGQKSKHLWVRDALFDPISAGEFDVVVTNPPYLSARNLPGPMVARMKRKYPAGWRDACACFILRSLQLLRPGGRAGILSMQSFMFTGGFTALRAALAESSVIETVAHFGPDLFGIGNPGTLQTAATVLQKTESPIPNRKAVFFRLVRSQEKSQALKSSVRSRRSAIRFVLSQEELQSFPRKAWMYWLSSAARAAFAQLPALGEIAPPRQGLATSDNARFVRYWWEVERPNFHGPRTKWLKYAKGGGFRRWHEPAIHRVNWENDGREIKRSIALRYPYLNGNWQWVAKNSAWYGKAGITYSYLTSSQFSARRLESGAIFDVAGSSLFPRDPLPILAVLNSSAARQLLEAINPTVNFQVGDLRQLPIPRKFPAQLGRDVKSAIELVRRMDSFDETQPNFDKPAPWNKTGGALRDIQERLGALEERIDRSVCALYGMEYEPDKRSVGTGFSPEDLARRWVSYALGRWLGRWNGPAFGDAAILRPMDAKLSDDLRRFLGNRADEIEQCVGGFERFFAREFVAWHNRIYRNRPVFWAFLAAERMIVVHGLTANAAVLRRAGVNAPRRWRVNLDAGTAANLLPLEAQLADLDLRRAIGNPAK